MNDHELIAAVAKLLGYTSIDELTNGRFRGYLPSVGWGNLPPWRTSVDAALGVLDKKVRLEILWNLDQQEFRLQYGDGGVQTAESLRLLPRAILLAFLEAK